MPKQPCDPPWSTFNRRLAALRLREERAAQASTILDALDPALGRREKIELYRDDNGLCFVRKSRRGAQGHEVQSTPSARGVTPRDALANAIQSETLTRR